MRLCLLIVLALAGCSDPNTLTYVSRSAPEWNINPTMWTGNDLTSSPTQPANIGPQASNP